MITPERSSFTTLDFVEWNEADTLWLSPKFQRRSVWTLQARSYLIDTVLKQMPVPPIYLRRAQNPEQTKTIREVIDGQQRLRAVLDYFAGDYALSKAVSEEAPGKRFDQLDKHQQDCIRNYSFVCETFSSISDEEVLEVFARMNTYSVKLNPQELRNGRYFGLFKRSAYQLAYEHLGFWRANKIFTRAMAGCDLHPNALRRKRDAKAHFFLSDLAIFVPTDNPLASAPSSLRAGRKRGIRDMIGAFDS